MIDIELLKILADGKFHSGTSIGEALGQSRSAVWKQMKSLQNFGVDVYSVRGRGYRLPKGLDLLSVNKISKHMGPETADQLDLVELKTFTDSTNLMALRNIKEYRHGALYMSEHQNAGRGRRGRQWLGSLATNLYFSLMWRFSGGAASLEGLSLVVGLSVVEGLSQLGMNGVELKWPNDLLCKGKKLAGILLEMQGDASGEVSVVIGVGVNVQMPQESAIASQIDQPWTDLASIVDKPIDRNKLLAVVVTRLINNLNVFSKTGFREFREPWHKYHVYQDAFIRLIIGENEIEGICRGVNEQGALLLERFGKIESYHGGEISVRSANSD
jgi:BirA family biotin operon repressor/biotin-[acetyl-CoA-carboxylase] ligase